AAAAARDLLRYVVTKGTARQAEVAGYRVGGKTGTADKPRPGGGYYKNRNVSTFAAMYPADKPVYVLVVTLDEPKVSVAGGGEVRTAGATAAPVAAALVERLSPLLGLRPDDVTLPVIEPRPADAVRISAR
ncbi:MAG: penicillin-binding transpeptidase domain-containing protein, partial [Gemmobacter sp.]